jgi:hypothetical protein
MNAIHFYFTLLALREMALDVYEKVFFFLFRKYHREKRKMCVSSECEMGKDKINKISIFIREFIKTKDFMTFRYFSMTIFLSH